MIANVDAALLLAGLDLGSSVAESDTLLEAARIETSVFEDLLADRVDLIPGTKGLLINKRVAVDFQGRTIPARPVMVIESADARPNRHRIPIRRSCSGPGLARPAPFRCRGSQDGRPWGHIGLISHYRPGP